MHCLIHLKDLPFSRIAIPQKTQAYLAAGRPIIMGVRGDAAELVARAGAGLLCTPEDPENIAETIQSMYNCSVEGASADGIARSRILST